MTIIPVGQLRITFKCPKCGPTRLLLSDGHADDSIASCNTCGHVFGRWNDVKQEAITEALPSVEEATAPFVRKLLDSGDTEDEIIDEDG